MGLLAKSQPGRHCGQVPAAPAGKWSGALTGPTLTSAMSSLLLQTARWHRTAPKPARCGTCGRGSQRDCATEVGWAGGRVGVWHSRPLVCTVASYPITPRLRPATQQLYGVLQPVLRTAFL